MQYLSKAYNYYSGINPATLSGAIDVIVVRKVNNDGTETLSSSPFHVRFGKLQVLRAGEKRVTIRLPNNLPAPHVAPFSMKVGETGEAFFVLETDEDVPEDLMTSPVVMPTEDNLPVASPGHEHLRNEDVQSLTQQPFGETERLAEDDDLKDVAFLDLNAPPAAGTAHASTGGQRAQSAASSSVLGIAASDIAPNPSLTDHGDSPSANLQEGPADSSEVRHKRNKSQPAPHRPLRDLGADTGEESSSLPASNHTPSRIPDDINNSRANGLPCVGTGEGAGPGVLEGNDVVLDMDGYHTEDRDRSTMGPSGKRGGAEVQYSVLDTFTRDLLAAVPSEKRPVMPLRATDPDFHPPGSPESDSLALSPDLEDRDLRRFDRAKSEPPVDSPEPLSPNLDPTKTASAMDYAWDWGRIPDGSDVQKQLSPERRGTLPPIDLPSHGTATRLKNVEENPFLFVFDADGRTHTFELALCDTASSTDLPVSDHFKATAFLDNRVSFQAFIENPSIVDNPKLVVRYSLRYLTWETDYPLLYALAMYRRSLTPPSQTPGLLPSLDELGVEAPRAEGYAWSRWWRRNQPTSPAIVSSPPTPPIAPPADASVPISRYAKTLRLSSDQLKQMNLKVGPNTIQFSVSSSYSGLAVCSARIFLWEESDQIVISDIDGTITKSDALGHVYAAIGRDWTHLGIAKLYTDITNNGYRMLYLTSRAIGQADSTRGYLKSIVQGDYRLPEGPVIMSPDRLMASLHREVIMRKPELFKMACLRDILRLFAEGTQEPFFAGFGNRITDAMSYRSVGIPASKIYTIDSTGVVKTELLQAAGHKGSYIQLNDLVNEVFPPVSTKFKPEYTDFNYWRSSIPDIALPDFSPPSPALSARSDTSSRLSVLGKITGLGRRTSRQPILPVADPSSRPSSPLIGPSLTSDELSEPNSRASSMPGSYEDKGSHFPAYLSENYDIEANDDAGQDDYDYDAEEDNFDDDLLATGEMRNVPF